MGLRLDTFDNATGGSTLYKALTHPHAVPAGERLRAALKEGGPVAVYDVGAAAEAFAELFDLGCVDIAGTYVQDIARLGDPVLGRPAFPVTELAASRARTVLVASFDAARAIAHIGPYLPQGARVLSLDRMRIPEPRIGNRERYLDPLNFATNFAFFRDAEGLHTRLTTVNYWAGYGAGAVTCWLTLFDATGAVIAEWCDSPRPAGAIVIDSRELRHRFRLSEFTGQLFLHVVGAAGHDVVKYALDTFGDEEVDATGDLSLSATHDANAWPADRYAGLPAPAPGERVLLWLQNSHGFPIPAGAIALSPMGEARRAAVREPIAPFASCAVDVGALLPDLAWPRQIEVFAGKYVVRPRYEIAAQGRKRIAHVNVERGDLRPDPELPKLAPLLGKGYLLPGPILPRSDWQTEILPTPMATCQERLPIAVYVYDTQGDEIARLPLGDLPRAHATAIDLDRVEAVAGLRGGYGHVELVYDFAAGGTADGWLHAIFRYRHRGSGHAAETSFGAHVFNTVLTYRGEPQSYAGRPPGLSTRLFLRLGDGRDTLCHLIYPASRPSRAASATEIILYDRTGHEVARSSLSIPCSGSRLLRYHALFDAAVRGRAGADAYAVIRDTTCRLFGYHGLVGTDGAFSLDHMFGF
jgi:hypothetical protein